VSETGNHSIPLKVRSRALDKELERRSCYTAADAKQFVLFALRCIQEPREEGVWPIPFCLMFLNPVLYNGVKLVDKWLAGEGVSIEQLQEADRLAYKAAREEAGIDNPNKLTGPQAIFWAAAKLVRAAMAAATAAAASERAFLSAFYARWLARQAANYARRTGQRLNHEAIDLQERLLSEILPPEPSSQQEP